MTTTIGHAVPENGSHLPQIAPQTRSALDSLLAKHGPLKGKSTLPILVFIVLRAAGWSNGRAYLAIRPTVTEKTATVLGSKLSRSHPRHIAALRSNPSLIELAMADLVPLRVMLNPESAARDALTAADQVNRRYGRYGSESAQVNVFTQGDALLSHLNDAPKPISLPADEEE